MAGYARERMEEYRRRQQAVDRARRLEYAERTLPEKFPSLSWWLDQRPAEVKPLHDHTTGLCRVKYSFSRAF